MDYTEYYNNIMQQVQQQMQASKTALKASIQSRASNVKGLGARIQAKTDEMFDSVQQKGYNPTQSILEHLMGLKEQEAKLEDTQSKAPAKSAGHFVGAGISYSGYDNLIDLLNKHEGGGDPDTLFGFSNREGGRFAGVKPSTMTLGELYEFTDPSGEYGQWVKQRLAETGQEPRVATPVGEGQIVGMTMKATAKELGLPDDTVFTRDVQRQMIAHLARKAYQRGGIKGLRKEWEGFKSVPDDVLEAAAQEFMSNTSVMPKASPFQQRKGR